MDLRTPMSPTAHAEQLRLSDDWYRALFDDHPVPMWVFDPDTLRFLAVNDAAVAHYGYSRDEFTGLTLTDIRPEEDVPRLISAVRRATGDGDGTWRHRKKDG